MKSDVMRNFLSGSRFSSKLVWMVIVMSLPVLVVASILVIYLNRDIEFANGELIGVECFEGVRAAYQPAAEHRRAAVEYLGNPEASRTRLTTLQTQVEQTLEQLDRAQAKFGKNPNTTERMATLKADWAGIRKAFEASTPAKPEDVVEAHDDFLGALSTMMTKSADQSKLTLDPEYAPYALMSLPQKLITTLTLVGEAELNARGVLGAKRPANEEERATYQRLLGRFDANKTDLTDNWDIVATQNAAVAETLKISYQKVLGGPEEFQKLLAATVYSTDAAARARLTPEKLAAAYDGTTRAGYEYLDADHPALRKLLTERVTRIRTYIYVSIGAILAGFSLVVLLVFSIVRNITKQISSIANVFDRISEGNYNDRVAVTSRDELGQIATGINRTLDNTVKLISSRDERDELQKSVMRLLEEISGVADGDLTKQAEVTADVTGAIADSFNLMIEQLRGLVGNVQDASVKVNASAVEIFTTANSIAEGSQSQADQILTTTERVDEMTVSIQQVSENAAQSAKVAEQALSTAKEGSENVQNTIDGMNRIRDQVQETSKRIKRLGESSQQIGEIVQLIDDIADRTSILALNASIQAAMAGEAGRGFAVVAEEVERLAERSTSATRKIASLVKSIQIETNEAVTAMEESTREVVDGSRLANRAGQSLNRIETVSQRLAELISSISSTSSLQAKASEGISRSMNQISKVTQSSVSGTKGAAIAATDLTELVGELRQSVSSFRL